MKKKSHARQDAVLVITPLQPTPPTSQGFNIKNNVPPQPPKSFRVILELEQRIKRIDMVLLHALRNQNENINLKHISRLAFKKLFDDKKIRIKGQPARPSSAVATGITYIDIME